MSKAGAVANPSVLGNRPADWIFTRLHTNRRIIPVESTLHERYGCLEFLHAVSELRRMSDNDRGKKMVESEELGFFLEARRHVTEEVLSVINATERPDFICQRECGEFVGVELCRCTKDRLTDRWQRLLGQPFTDPNTLLDNIIGSIERKQRKLREPDWRLADKTILVLQLFDLPFVGAYWLQDSQVMSQFARYGFAEIWVVDHTGLDAFGDVLLIGLHPARWWGVHARENEGSKPFG